MNETVEKVARAIAKDIGRQDGEDWALPPDLTVAWLDQGSVNFREVARAAIAALEACGWRGPDALAKARNEALEEAAKVAATWKSDMRLGETQRSRFSRYDMNCIISAVGKAIEEDIRALTAPPSPGVSAHSGASVLGSGEKPD